MLRIFFYIYAGKWKSNYWVQTKEGLKARGPINTISLPHCGWRACRGCWTGGREDVSREYRGRGRASKCEYAAICGPHPIFCKAITQSVLTLKAILKCFELASGLKVNYSKSKVGGVGVKINQTMVYAFILNCDIIQAPFNYLAVTIWRNHKICIFWEGMLNKLRSRLSSWKGKFFSMAGRICLIKFVLTSLLLF